ncbi:hypothetical protein Tco_0979803, partial [Tanacetum coccineum]
EVRLPHAVWLFGSEREVRLPHAVWLFGSERYVYLMMCGYLDQRGEPSEVVEVMMCG